MFNRNSIRFKVAAIVFSAVVLALGGFGFFLDAQIRGINEREELAKLKGTNQLVINMIAQTDASLRQQTGNWAHAFSAAVSGEYVLEASGDSPLLKLNGVPLNGSEKEVDAFTSSSSGNVATLFARKGDDFVRIATSLRKEDGTRAVGTMLGKNHPAYAAVSAGKPFIGKATLFSRSYMTQYDPIRDGKGEVIGIRFVGMDIVASLDYLKQTIKKIVLGQTGYTYVLDATPGAGAGTLVIHPAQEGKNIIDSADGDGKLFIRKILEARNGTIVYPWINASMGETRSRDKVVVFNEYKDWNWIVGSGSYSDEIFSLAARARNIMIVATFVLTITLLAILIFYLNRIVIAPLGSLVASSRRIADGDLAVVLDADRKDEVGEVMRAMNDMVVRLREIIAGVRSTGDTISAAAENLSAATTQVSQASEQQALATASAAAALEEVTVSINEVSMLARANEESSKRTATLSRDSVAAIREAVSGMEEMAVSIAAASEQVGGLVSRSDEIGGIAGVIREIAEQTNLLALNAAIEAARAGEQGRGFAVVADEVRKLAERTARATQEIAQVIGKIQQETQQTVGGMQAAKPKIESGLEKVGEVSTMLDRIDGEAAESQNRALEVAHATKEQAVAADDIAHNVEQVAQMTEETNATIQANAASASELQIMAKELHERVAYFKLG